MSTTALPGLDLYNDSDPESDTCVTSNAASAVNEQLKCSNLADVAAVSVPKPVQGEWLCFCFVELMVSDRLHKLVAEAHKLAKTAASTFIGGMDTETRMLHVSLTRPMTIRAYERDEFVREAIDVAHHAEFHRTSLALAFSRFAHLQNDQETRDFLVLEIGTGREILHVLSSALGNRLQKAFRAQPYYDEARFHASTGYLPLPSQTANLMDSVVQQLESKLGKELRALQPTFPHRIGIQIGASITYANL